MIGERDVAHGCVDEHPLVQRDGRVLLRQSFEHGQIDGEADLRNQAEQVADDAAVAATGSVATHDKYQCPYGTYEDTQYFQVGDRLFQVDGSYDHGDDGQCGGHDGGVDGRSHGRPEEVDTWCQKLGEEYLQHIPMVHLFALAEGGQQPEAGCRSHHAECGH